MPKSSEKTFSDYWALFIFALVGLFSTHTAFRYLFGLTQSVNSLLDEKNSPREYSSPLAKLGSVLIGGNSGWLVFIIMLVSIIFIAYWVVIFSRELSENKISFFVIVFVFYSLMAIPSVIEWHAENYRAPEHVREQQNTKEQQLINAEIDEYVLGEGIGKGVITIDGTNGKISGKLVIEHDKYYLGEKISEGFYFVKSNVKNLNINKTGDQSIVSMLEEISKQMKLEEASQYHFYTDGRSIIDREDNSTFYCIYGEKGSCKIDGNEWHVGLTKDCSCTDYSVNKTITGSQKFIESGLVCKNSATPACKAKEYTKLEFDESGTSFRIYVKKI